MLAAFYYLVVAILPVRTSRSFVLWFVLRVLFGTAIFFRLLCHERSLRFS